MSKRRKLRNLRKLRNQRTAKRKELLNKESQNQQTKGVMNAQLKIAALLICIKKEASKCPLNSETRLEILQFLLSLVMKSSPMLITSMRLSKVIMPSHLDNIYKCIRL